MIKIFFSCILMFFFFTSALHNSIRKLEVIFSCELEENIKFKQNEKNSIQKFLALLTDIKNKMKYSEDETLTFFISQIESQKIRRNKSFDSSKIDAFILKDSNEQRAFRFFDDNFFNQNESEQEIDDLEQEIFNSEKEFPAYLSKYYFKKIGLNLYIGKNFPEKKEKFDIFFIIHEGDINEILYDFNTNNHNIFIINPKKNSKVFYYEQKVYQLGCPQKKDEYGILKLTFQDKNLIRQSYETIFINTKNSNQSYILHNY